MQLLEIQMLTVFRSGKVVKETDKYTIFCSKMKDSS